jgi:hypothetical protein
MISLIGIGEAGCNVVSLFEEHTFLKEEIMESTQGNYRE